MIRSRAESARVFSTARRSKNMSAGYQHWMRELNGQQLADRIWGRDFDDEFVDYRGDWVPIPRAWFNEYRLYGNDFRSIEWNQNWTFAENDRGAVTFAVENAKAGLIVDLGGQNSDAFGYFIVLDDDSRRSYVMRKHVGSGHNVPSRPFQAQRHERLTDVRVDPSFRLDPDSTNRLWLTYEYGRIRIGKGDAPGRGPVVLEANDPRSAPGIQQVGFGKMGNRSQHPIVLKEVLSYGPNRRSTGMNPYNRTINAPHYWQCWREYLYPR